MPLSLNAETALAYAEELSYPRLVGSPGEAEAIAALSRRLSAAGCVVEHAPFAFSAGAQVAAAATILLAQALVLFTYWAGTVSSAAGVVSATVLLSLLACAGRLQRLAVLASLEPADGMRPTRWQHLWSRLGQRYQTVNIVARPSQPARTGNPALRRQVYLVAHSDSKSQPLPLAVRMVLIGVAAVSATGFATLSLLRPWWPGLTSAAALAGLVALIAGLPLVYLFLAGSGNASPGAIDNASGAGLVVHLAEVLAADAPALDLTFLITGAEELGVVGATAFVLGAQRAGHLPRHAGASEVFVLNFDGVGGGGRLAFVGGRQAGRLAALVRDCCMGLRLPVGRLPLVGALFDHIPFAEAGCDALSLVTLGPASRTVHTAADSADRLEAEGFRQAGEVALAVIDRLAQGL